MQVRDTVTVDRDARETTNEALLKTLRLYFQGNVLDADIKYTIQLALGAKDFESGNASPIFDAWVEFTHLRDARLRVGQYFVPFDRARTTREFALQFVDRQLPVRELTLDRDLGVMVYSQDLFGLDGALAYNVFVGGGEGRNHAVAEASGPMIVARLSYRPFGAFDDDQEADLERRPSPRLAVGAGFAYNPQSSRAQSTFGATFRRARFNYAQAAADVVFKYAGLSLLAEAVVRSADRDFAEFVDTDGTTVREWSREAWGYFAQLGYMFTRHTEVVGRWEQLRTFGAATDPTLESLIASTGDQAGGGLNVYLNGHAFKFQTDYFYAFGESGRGRHTARIQLDATF